MVLSVLAESPPSLTSFHQFYGTIMELPANQTFTLKATVGANSFTTPVTIEGKYGYSPTFKVQGVNDAIIVFGVIDQINIEKTIGRFTYKNGVVTELSLNYSYIETEPSASNRTQKKENKTIITSTQPTSPKTCTQSWECGDWGLCRDSQQSRICYRVDNCDQLKVQGQVSDIVSIPKPPEQQSCQPEVAEPVATICSPELKRCLGTQLQQCSSDGKQWFTLQACLNGCDAITIECNAAPSAPHKEQSSNALWYYLLGSLLLIVVISAVAGSILHLRKYAPAKKYITICRKQGLPDQKTKIKLVDAGWDSGKVDALLQKK